MYLLGEQPAYADQLINRLQSIPTQLLEGLEPVGAAVTFERVDDLGQELWRQRRNCLWQLACCRRLGQRPSGWLLFGRQPDDASSTGTRHPIRRQPEDASSLGASLKTPAP